MVREVINLSPLKRFNRRESFLFFVYIFKFYSCYLWVIKMKKNSNMQSKSNQKMTDSCNKSNVSNRASSSKVTNKSNKNIGFENEASSFELDRSNEDSFKLR